MGTSLVTMLNTPTHMLPSLNTKLASVIDNGKWNIPSPLIHFPTVAEKTLKITLASGHSVTG